MNKRYRKALEFFDRDKRYSLLEALDFLSKLPNAKFDESIDIAVRLGVDPKQTEQNVRGAVSLPHGTGRTVRVAVFAKGEKADAAKAAGADVIGAEDLAERVEKGFLDFDKVVATPDMMVLLGKLGKVLGPRGLMPNPKLGTVTPDVKKAVTELKSGKIEFRLDKGSVVHAVVGKKSFSSEKLKENIEMFVDTLNKAKPSSSKGVYLRSIAISSTMGPGIKIDPSPFVVVQ